jgi:hypothetical protein
MLIQRKTMSSHNLTEDFWSNLEMLVTVVILEEALSIESVAANNFLKADNNIINALDFISVGMFAAISSSLSRIAKNNINILFEVFLGENSIY